MPKDRAFPLKYLPRLGSRLSVTIGHPVPTDKVKEALDGVPGQLFSGEHACLKAGYARTAPQRATRNVVVPNTSTTRVPGSEQERMLIRSRVTTLIQQEVEALGYCVSGPLLGK